jgi:hypothetical protein
METAQRRFQFSVYAWRVNCGGNLFRSMLLISDKILLKLSVLKKKIICYIAIILSILVFQLRGRDNLNYVFRRWHVSGPCQSMGSEFYQTEKLHDLILILHFYTLAFKNVGALCYITVCPFVSPSNSVFATTRKLFRGFWWNIAQRKITLCKCACYKRSPVQILLKELWPLDLTFSLKNTFVFATHPKPFVQCTMMHLTKGMLFQTV